MEHDLAVTVFGYVTLRIAIIASVAAGLYYLSRQHTRASRVSIRTRLTSTTRSARYRG